MKRIFSLQTITLLSALTALMLPILPAYADCEVRYAYAPQPFQSSSVTITLGEGESQTINQDNTLYVQNQGSNPVRVFRTGIGSYVELQADGRDPSVGPQYAFAVTLQRVECLADGPPPPHVIEQFFRRC